MDFRIKTGQPGKQRTGCAMVGLYARKKLSRAAQQLNQACGRSVTAACNRGDISGKLGEMVLLPNPGKGGPARILVVGCGDKAKFTLKTYRRVTLAAIRHLAQTGAKDAINYVGNDLDDSYATVRSGIESAGEALYRFDQLRSKPPKKPAITSLGFPCTRDDKSAGELGMRHGKAIADGMRLTRELGNLPSNICTPTYLADQAKLLAQRYKSISTRVLGPSQIKRIGMNTFLSVSAGAHEPPQFIEAKYTGDASGSAPIVLVGKGITFDTGGISMKPAYGMEEMKFDMCGAAAVLGVLLTSSRLRLPCNLVALIPTCANMPGGNATNPGDIVKTLSGQTVEILNTDAEGRLILCDALTYAQKFQPQTIIDVATLTGACVIALGHLVSGLMSNDNDLAKNLLNAGEQALDPAWQLPIGEDFELPLKSKFADFANVGNRSGGAITAACFLSKFTRKQKWAHLDVAGTAWQSGPHKGTTGRPVPLLTQYLLNQTGLSPK